MILGSLCFLISSILVVAALWPFNPFPPNRVSWLSTDSGLRFDPDGIVQSSVVFRSSHSAGMAFCSLEISLEPAISNVPGSETILAFYKPDDSTGFRLLQHFDEFLVQRDFIDGQHRLGTAEIKVIQAFNSPGRKLFTITSHSNGTAIYQDGKFAESNSGFGMTCESLSGQVTLGNSSTAYDSWQGNVSGLAFYRQGLTPAQIMNHYQSWSRASGPGELKNDGLFGFYSFSEHGGRTIHNTVGDEPNLFIPSTFSIPHKAFLELPWHEFSLSIAYLWDVSLNIAGFLPFGFFVCAYFDCDHSRKRAALITIVLGATVSLSFEILQGFLPTRSSGVTDIITNTVGTAIGVLLVSSSLAHKMFAKLRSCLTSILGSLA